MRVARGGTRYKKRTRNDVGQRPQRRLNLRYLVRILGYEIAIHVQPTLRRVDRILGSRRWLGRRRAAALRVGRSCHQEDGICGGAIEGGVKRKKKMEKEKGFWEGARRCRLAATRL